MRSFVVKAGVVVLVVLRVLRTDPSIDLSLSNSKLSSYCREYMLDRPPRQSSSSSRSPTDDDEDGRPPSIRIKVVPASFGLDGFEDAVWEATEDALVGIHRDDDDEGAASSRRSVTTLVVAAPDLFTDPALLEGDGREGGHRPRLSSPQAEFESDRFREFASALEGRLAEFSRLVGAEGAGGGGVTTSYSSSSSDDEDVHFATFHPLWRTDGTGEGGALPRESFPYPCFAVSSTIKA